MRFSKTIKTTQDLAKKIRETAEFVGTCGPHDDTGQVALLRLGNMSDAAYAHFAGCRVVVGGLQDYLSDDGVFDDIPSKNDLAAAVETAEEAVKIVTATHPLGVRVMFTGEQGVVFAGGEYHYGGHSRKRGWLEIWSQDHVSKSWAVIHFEEVDGHGYDAMRKIAESDDALAVLLHLAENGSLREVKK